MERRNFLAKAGIGGVAALGLAACGKNEEPKQAAPPAAAPAAAPVTAPSAVGKEEIRWRLASSFPKSLDTIYGGAEHMAKRVSEATGGKFQIQVFAAGEIVPGPGVLDAVKDNTVEMGHTASFYFFGKDPTFAFECAIPFGMTMRQLDSWMRYGNGGKLMGEFFAKYNIVSIPCGNTGTQMAGWFRKEIKTVDDMKGLKMRIGGYAGAVMSKLGVVPQQIPGGDIYPALEKGTIDAAEWIGPYDDNKLGFNKVAKFYYYPGWWEGGTTLSAYVNAKKFAELPKEYQAILQDACAEAHTDMMAKYDARNPTALKQLVGSGTQLRPLSKDILDACYKAAQELYAETSATNAEFKKVYDDYKKFMDDQNLWHRVAEASYANYMFGKR